MFARRTRPGRGVRPPGGRSWFIAGMNGTDAARPVELDLAAFKKFPHRLAVTEGPEPILQVAVAPLTKAARWQQVLPPRGGFILRLDN